MTTDSNKEQTMAANEQSVAERLRQFAESLRMDFDAPDSAAMLECAADALLASDGGTDRLDRDATVLASATWRYEYVNVGKKFEGLAGWDRESWLRSEGRYFDAVLAHLQKERGEDLPDMPVSLGPLEHCIRHIGGAHGDYVGEVMHRPRAEWTSCDCEGRGS